jgi:hypothetical protein
MACEGKSLNAGARMVLMDLISPTHLAHERHDPRL